MLDENEMVYPAFKCCHDALAEVKMMKATEDFGRSS